MTDTYTLHIVRRIEIHHGRITFQNLIPPLCCPKCNSKVEIITFEGGYLIEELNKPSLNDPSPRRGFIFIPQKVAWEKAYSKFAKPAITFRSKNLNVALDDFT